MVIKTSIKNERLGIDFNNERSVFIKGEYINGVFRVRTEDFETFSGLSDSDKQEIRTAISNNSFIIID